MGITVQPRKRSSWVVRADEVAYRLADVASLFSL